MEDKGFFGSLFDIRFRSFVTTKIVPALFIISLVVSGIYTIFLVATVFGADSGAGIFVLIVSPLIYFLLVLYSRVVLEFLVVVFRIYENTSVMAGRGPMAGPPAAYHPSTVSQPPMPPAGPESPGPQSPQP